MKNGLLNTLRVAVGALLLFAAVYGYVCHERTLVSRWMPVALSLAAAALTAPLLASRWRWLTRTSDRTVNRLCHLLGAGALFYFLFMGGNSLLADPASEYMEEVTVVHKERKERHRMHRAGRRMVRGESYTVYFVEVVFADSTRRRIQVPRAVHAACAENRRKRVSMRRGFFGFPVLKRFGAPGVGPREPRGE